MSIHGVLGESTSYPKTYSPEVLYPIARKLGRDAIGWQADKLGVGMDWWHAFELSWLDPVGISQVAMARLSIPAHSSHIIESKSLKLYLNSLNFTQFEDWYTVQKTIATDVSAYVGSAVSVELFALDALSAESGLCIAMPEGVCIDAALSHLTTALPLTEHPESSLLSVNFQPSTQPDLNQSAQTDGYHFYSHLLRSNCPVTNQPDWGTVAVSMYSTEIPDYASVLAYLLSFRQHNGFHEQCVEQIFADLSRHYQPSQLMVRAWYTRRGGIDINPCRVSQPSLLPQPSRLVRQ